VVDDSAVVIPEETLMEYKSDERCVVCCSRICSCDSQYQWSSQFLKCGMVILAVAKNNEPQHKHLINFFTHIF